MKDDIADTARAVLTGSARGDDAKRLARWVLERVEEEAAPWEACGGCGIDHTTDDCRAGDECEALR